MFKAAGHPARLRILGMLRPGGLCVCQITAVLDLAVSTVSAHLAELKRAGSALSLPSMIVIRSYLGMRKTAAYVAIVVALATFAGCVYGALWG